MNIKISSLRSLLHDSSSFSLRSINYIKSIENELKCKIEYSSIDDYDCDLKLIYIETGGSEMLFKESLDKIKEPFFFLTSGEDNSLAATLEILTYLKSIGKNGEILHGSINYISNRIKELSNCNDNKILNEKRYGVIGTPSDWLISSIPNYNDVFRKYGAILIDIPLTEVINSYNSFSKEIIVDPLNFKDSEVKKAHIVYEVIKEIIHKYNLNGFTIRCFDLLEKIKTTGCLALAKLNSEGYISTCEGDIMAMLTMAIAKEISSKSSFQANPSRIDTLNNTIIFAHCTVPLDMLESYKYNTHFESGIGVAIKGELSKKEVTILRLSKDLNSYFCSKGYIINNLELDNLCRTQILVKLNNDVQELLTKPCGNHHIIFYGDYVDKINSILNK